MSQTPMPTSSAAPVGHQQANGLVSQQENATPPSVLREPPTGKQFLESLRDGRMIYSDGKLVKDVTTHPAFATRPLFHCSDS